MAISTVGTADLVAALTGGGSVEDAAYAKQANRILEAQNKQAMLDKRVLDANLTRDIMRGRGNFERNSMDLPEMVRFAVMGDMADQLKYGQEAIGVGQKNAGRQQIQDIAAQAQEGGAPSADVINMIVSAIAGKHLGSDNVRVRDQADADIGLTNARSSEAAGMEAFNRARAAAEGVNPDGTVTPNLENITGIQQSMLWADPATIPVTYDNPGIFTGDTTENLPLSDPRAAKQWAEMDEDEQAAMAQFLGPEFAQWRQANIGARPELKDASIAVGAFLAEQMGQRGSTQKRPTRTELYKPSDSDFADVESGKASPEDFEAFFGVPYTIARRPVSQ